MVTILSVVLLVAGVAGALARPSGLPAWAVPVAAAAVAVAGPVSITEARSSVGPLVEPVAFLLFAVPLAAQLDRLGFFDAAAARVRGRHAPVGLWALAALTVAVLNLDAAVVLLTPLYIRIARSWDVDPVPYAFVPALLACLASSALPVSNLTNLVVVERLEVGAGSFLSELGGPTVAACTVGYLLWRRALRPALPAAGGVPARGHGKALLGGAAVIALLVVGFVPGRALGLEAWMVAGAVNVLLLLCDRRTRPWPWSSVPWGTAVLVSTLAVLAGGAAPALPVEDLLGSGGGIAVARSAAVGAVTANAVNNLPALLLALDALNATRVSPAIWALLLGVNAGPVVLVTGSLSGVLWLDATRREGVDVGPGNYARVGIAVGVPSFAAAVAVLLALA